LMRPPAAACLARVQWNRHHHCCFLSSPLLLYLRTFCTTKWRTRRPCGCWQMRSTRLTSLAAAVAPVCMAHAVWSRRPLHSYIRVSLHRSIQTPLRSAPRSTLSQFRSCQVPNRRLARLNTVVLIGGGQSYHSAAALIQAAYSTQTLTAHRRSQHSNTSSTQTLTACRQLNDWQLGMELKQLAQSSLQHDTGQRDSPRLPSHVSPASSVATSAAPRRERCAVSTAASTHSKTAVGSTRSTAAAASTHSIKAVGSTRSTAAAASTHSMAAVASARSTAAATRSAAALIQVAARRHLGAQQLGVGQLASQPDPQGAIELTIFGTPKPVGEVRAAAKPVGELSALTWPVKPVGKPVTPSKPVGEVESAAAKPVGELSAPTWPLEPVGKPASPSKPIGEVGSAAAKPVGELSALTHLHMTSTTGPHVAPANSTHVASHGSSHVASAHGSRVTKATGSHVASVAHSHVASPSSSRVGSTDDLHVASVAHLHVAPPAGSHVASAKGSLHVGHVMAQQSTPLLTGCRGIDWGGQYHHTHHTHMQLIKSPNDQPLPDKGGRVIYHHTHMQRMALTHDTHAALRPHDPGLAAILFLNMAALPLGRVNASCSTHNQLAPSLGGCCGADLGGAGLSVVSPCIHAL
jgi:hypothetical protein